MSPHELCRPRAAGSHIRLPESRHRPSFGTTSLSLNNNTRHMQSLTITPRPRTLSETRIPVPRFPADLAGKLLALSLDEVLPGGRVVATSFRGVLPTPVNLPRTGNHEGDMWQVGPNYWIWTGGLTGTQPLQWIDP